MKIYVVMGATSESEWLVYAYRYESEAQKHVALANERSQEIETSRPGRVLNKSNVFDPHMPNDCTDAEYSYDTVELSEYA